MEMEHSMEEAYPWPSCEHGTPCFLKTGTRPGKKFRKNMFMCSKHPAEMCNFVKNVNVSCMECPKHGNIVSVRFKFGNRVKYRCSNGPPWCGVVPWTEERQQEKENNPPNIPAITTTTCGTEDINCSQPGTHSEDCSENVSQTQSEDIIRNQSETDSEDLSEDISGDTSQNQSETHSHDASQNQSETQSEYASQNQSETQSEYDSQNQSETHSHDASQNQSETHSHDASQNQSETHSNDDGQNQSETHSNDDGQNQSETQSEYDSQNQSETQSEYNTQNQSEADSEDINLNQSETCTVGVSQDHSEKHSDNINLNQSEMYTKDDSQDQSETHSENISVNQSETHSEDVSEVASQDQSETHSEGVSQLHTKDVSQNQFETHSDNLSREEEEEEECVDGDNERSMSDRSDCQIVDGEQCDIAEEYSWVEECNVVEDVEECDAGVEGVNMTDAVVHGRGSPVEEDDRVEESGAVVKCDDVEKECDAIVVEKSPSPQFKLGSQYRTLYRQMQQTETLLKTMADKLPDGGEKLRQQYSMIQKKISTIKRTPPPQPPTATATGKLFQRGLDFQARFLSSGVVEHLHNSLESCPDEDTLAEQPVEVIPLYQHQLRALAWMLWREGEVPSGGILADEMGLGKTLSMLSLILKNPSDMSHREDGLVSSRATLIVCSLSLIHQWKAEIFTKIKSDTLSVLLYHGPKRPDSPYELADYDVVITTYDIVGSEGAAFLNIGNDNHSGRRRRMASITTLCKVYWHRIVLDEAHKIRNPKTAMAKGVTALKKVHRWAVTGTPVQNKLADLYSLVNFLDLAPFNDIKEWKRSIENKSVVGMQRLKTMMAVLLLRRTKMDIASTHKLPEKIISTHTVDLQLEEKNVYDALFYEARNVFVRFLAEHKQQVGDSTDEPQTTTTTATDIVSPSSSLSPAVQHCLDCILHAFRSGDIQHGVVLVMLLRLRQCCCHPVLMISDSMGDVNVEEGLEEAFTSLAIDHVTDPKKSSQLPAVFREESLSTKICEVLKEVKRIVALDPPEKCVIVSQWRRLLDVIRYHLEMQGISCIAIDGRVSPKDRASNVTKFNSANPNPSVMLLSMIAGGEGLNLVGGNHMFILDMHWNPAVELQATDRIHRMGQTRDVHVHKFICQGTIEERIAQLQQKKLELSASVLSGASNSQRSNKLSLNDLKVLFQVQ